MGASASKVCARVRGVSYSDESLKGTRRPRLPVLVPCVVYPQLSCSCQPPFGLSGALLACCCCLRHCRAADIIFARHSQFHFSVLNNCELLSTCVHVRDAGITRTQAQLVPRRYMRCNNTNRQKSPLNSLTLAQISRLRCNTCKSAYRSEELVLKDYFLSAFN